MGKHYLALGYFFLAVLCALGSQTTGYIGFQKGMIYCAASAGFVGAAYFIAALCDGTVDKNG